MTNSWYVINDIDQIDSPALVIYKERVQHNIALAIKIVGDASRLRPHVKTHKSPQVTLLMMQAGITKFKCATIAEAEMLARCNAPEVLLAYQPTGPKVHRLLSLIQQYRYTHFSCIIDSADTAKYLAAEAAAQRLIIDVLLDLNVGMNRTGVLPKHAVTLYEACHKMKGINLIGLHGYDGHINDADINMRKKRADEAFLKLDAVREALPSKGFTKPIIVISGSPTFAIHAQRKDVDCSPGTFVYWDKGYEQQLPDLQFLPAALVISRVVSIVNEKRICIDLGHKSIAAENPLNRRVYFLNAEQLEPVGHSEEHLVLEAKLPHSYKIGDVLYGIPFHICPTCALFEEAYVVENGKVNETWQMVARDRKIFI